MEKGEHYIPEFMQGSCRQNLCVVSLKMFAGFFVPSGNDFIISFLYKRILENINLSFPDKNRERRSVGNYFFHWLLLTHSFVSAVLFVRISGALY